MINLDSITNENKIERNEKWLFIPDPPYKILIIGASGSGKKNVLINLVKNKTILTRLFVCKKCK